MISMPLPLWPQYFKGSAWQEAFTFLETLGPMTPVQDYLPLRGDAIFARVMRYDTKTPERAIVEAHRRYIDIQMSLLGSEGMRWYAPETLTVKTPYDAEKDAEFYENGAHPQGHVENVPGLCTILFPEDPHMPQLTLDGACAPVLKVVVKLRVDLVR